MSMRGRELYTPARLTRISSAAQASLIQIVGLLRFVSMEIIDSSSEDVPSKPESDEG